VACGRLAEQTDEPFTHIYANVAVLGHRRQAMAMKFSQHPSFPAKQAFSTPGGFLWKLQVREWAFAQVNLDGVTDPGIGVTSNNPNPVPDERDKPHKALKFTKATTKDRLTVRFYAKETGFTFVQPFKGDPWTAAEDLRLQVEVITRRAPKQDSISKTTLRGSTVALNAPDARAYTMDTTLTFDANATNPASHFASVPKGVNHVVISTHGGVASEADKSDSTKICLFVTGFTTAAKRIDVDNAQTAFGVLKGKVAENCVLWFGGCTIGANEKFCQIAADASGCIVVAPVMALPFTTFPKGQIDILDRFAIPKIFVPASAGSNAATLKALSEFCAKQDELKFEVPA
jgi:hypothetical protein